ncbi:MAG: molybdopterin-dependent oxidoreductase [Candidatus Hydrogenedentes bacterium]|nr:molybdopterin-dependent oxidoreductase [Candidatus Hydrogenedentota bacterium]
MPFQITTFIIATVLSWYGMMMFHETGHCVGALLRGGAIESVGIPLLGFSQTHYRENPHPLFTVWAGPVGGDVEQAITVSDALYQLPRVEQVSDFHCVTTWTRRALVWSGFRFADFYEHIVKPEVRPEEGAEFVVLKGQDGYRSSLPLSDLLRENVLLADTLDGRPLSVAHGAPLRLVAPAHYAYKSVKHVHRIAFRVDVEGYNPAGLSFMAHPRARVALEERATFGPGWLFRYLYRPLVGFTAARFCRAMDEFERRRKSDESGDPGSGSV